jgi:hypothetical protein
MEIDVSKVLVEFSPHKFKNIDLELLHKHTYK